MGGQIQAAYNAFPIVGWWIRADRMLTHEADTQNERHGEQYGLVSRDCFRNYLLQISTVLCLRRNLFQGTACSV